MMFPRLSVVVCGLVVLAGCAAEEIDGDPPGPGTGNTTSTSGSGGMGSGGTPSTTGGKPSSAGTGSGVGNSPGTAGTVGSGGTPGSAGTAGSGGTPGSAGTGTSGTGTSAGTGGMPVISLPLTENFEDGVADGFMPWNQDMKPGAWNIVTDGATKVYQPMAPVSELEFAVGGKTAWTDVALKVRVKLANADSDAQVVVRFKEPKTYLFVEMAEGKYKLRGRADGSTADIVTPSPKPTIVAGTWYTVGITIKGTNASLTLNDMLIGSGACDALISNGGVAVGVAEGSVAFDDLTVTAAP